MRFSNYSKFPMKNILIFLLFLTLTFSDNVTTSSFTIDGPTHDIVWCGSEEVSGLWDSNTTQPIYLKKTVFVVSGKGTVYRSINEGANFENIKPKLVKAASQFGKSNAFGTIMKIYSSDADQNFLLFHGFGGVSFLSGDCGSTIQAFEHNEEFFEFKLNPTDTNYILASSKLNCSDLSPDYCPLAVDLHYSDKRGLNWRKIQTSVIEFAWACSNKYYKHLIPIERIIITRANDDNKTSASMPTKTLYSDNAFENYIVLSPKGYRFFLTNEFLYVLEAEDLVERRFSLKISPNYYRDYKLSIVELPIQRLKDHSFTILESTDSSIFINVNHYGDDAKFGNVYMSNSEGRKFALSLLHNVRDDKGFCDFDRIKSLEGVFIANHYEHLEAEKFKTSYNYLSNSEDKKYKHESIDSYKKSVITYDKGSYWHPIPAPEVDVHGKKINCDGECSLHLRGFTDKYSNPLYSSTSSIGIIMGVGNTGIYLAQKHEEVNTYLSRDGGHSWFEVDKGSYIYEIGDHGGLIVMADDTKPTKTVKYSWNEGLTWEYLTFSDEEIDVSNIIIEPMNMALKFLMYGKKTNLESGSEGVIFFLDFSTLKQRVCSGLWNPGAEESDYEIWIPGSMEEKKCLFGKRMKYVRRKRNAYCFNGEDYEKKNIVDFCPCVEEDWECDFGFYRKEGSKDCVPISSEFEHKLNNFTEPENCTDYYEVPSGYRKIPGDYCVGGIDKLLAKQIRCSKSSSSYVSVKGNIDSKQSNQNIEDTQLPWGKIKIAVFSILFFALIYIFREDFIKLLVNALSLVKKIGRKRNDDNRRDYERVGAPLNNMNDDEEDEDNI